MALDLLAMPPHEIIGACSNVPREHFPLGSRESIPALNQGFSAFTPSIYDEPASLSNLTKAFVVASEKREVRTILSPAHHFTDRPAEIHNSENERSANKTLRSAVTELHAFCRIWAAHT